MVTVCYSEGDVHVRTFATDEGKRAIILHVLNKVRGMGTVPEFHDMDVVQQTSTTLEAIGDVPVYCAVDNVGNVAICALTELTLDPHCCGLGLYVGYFIAASANPRVASTLMRLSIRYAKAVNANWLGVSKRVGVNRYTHRYHYL